MEVANNYTPNSSTLDVESPIDTEFQFGEIGCVEMERCHDYAGIEADNEESSPESSPSFRMNVARNPSFGLRPIQEFVQNTLQNPNNAEEHSDAILASTTDLSPQKCDKFVVDALTIHLAAGGHNVESENPATSRWVLTPESIDDCFREDSEAYQPKEIIKEFLNESREQTVIQDYYSSNSSETSPIAAFPRTQYLAQMRSDALPQSFTVRFLGTRPCKGFWGIHNTRKPTDELVMEAKTTKGAQNISTLVLTVSEDGVFLEGNSSNLETSNIPNFIPIQNISYGVQDVRFTRAVAFVVVSDGLKAAESSSSCFVYLCDTKLSARKIAYSLAKAFKDYGRRIQGLKDIVASGLKSTIFPLKEDGE